MEIITPKYTLCSKPLYVSTLISLQYLPKIFNLTDPERSRNATIKLSTYVDPVVLCVLQGLVLFILSIFSLYFITVGLFLTFPFIPTS